MRVKPQAVPLNAHTKVIYASLLLILTIQILIQPSTNLEQPEKKAITAKSHACTKDTVIYTTTW